MKLYSGQFVFFHLSYDFKNVNHVKLGDWNLYIESDTAFESHEKNNREIVLIGDAFHAKNYQWSNKQIVADLLEGRNLDEVIQRTYYLAGVYVLIISIDDEYFVVPDTCALKEYYFAEGIIASQPHIIGKLSDAQTVQNNIALDYFNSDVFKKRPVYPYKKTHLKGVEKAIPNHYTDVKALKQVRFYPNDEILDIGLEEGKSIVKELGSGILRAINERYQLAIALTAGWDSRLLLALSRPICNEVEYFTQLWRPNPQNPDYTIPKILANKLSLKNYNQYKYSGNRPSSGHAGLYIQDQNLTNLLGSEIKSQFGNKAIISGELINLLRGSHARDTYMLDWRELSTLFSRVNFPYIDKEIKKYYKDANLLRDFNVNLLSLFYWEILLSAEVSRPISHYHYCKLNYLLPFNCRALLHYSLARTNLYGGKYRSELFTSIYKEEIPEVKNVLLNPGFKESIGKLLQEFGLFDLVVAISRKIRYCYDKYF